MKTELPHFVELVMDASGEVIWTLRGDDFIRPEIIKAGRLNWDKTFADIPEIDDRPGVAVDIGAYIGDTVPWFAQRGYKVVAIEAYPDAYLCCRNNTFANSMCLIMGNGEKVRLRYDNGTPDEKAFNGGGRSINRDETGYPTTRLDDLDISDLALLKIDVEGFEPAVLDGAAKTIERDKPVVIVEVNLPCLERLGFKQSDIEDRFKGWKAREIYRYGEHQWDMLYVHPDTRYGG